MVIVHHILQIESSFAVTVLNVCNDRYLLGNSNFQHIFATSSTDCPKTAGDAVENFEHSIILVFGHTKQ